MVPDGPNAVRSLALEFRLPDGQQWRTGMNDIPVFPLKDPRAFYEQLGATAPDPKTGKPDPAAVQAFFAAHPESARALALIKAKPFSSGFANATYNSLNASSSSTAQARSDRYAGRWCPSMPSRRSLPIRRATGTTCSMPWLRG